MNIFYSFEELEGWNTHNLMLLLTIILPQVVEINENILGV